MNKELFVSSTPHESKVGLVEDDLLAEIYLERENEYTLAGSIYKGRVTRVLPGMQSAFVDIGLERDAFLYVSDFMELEEHDEDVTDVVPVSRNVTEARPPQEHPEAAPPPSENAVPSSSGPSFVIESESFSGDQDEATHEAPAVPMSEAVPTQSGAEPTHNGAQEEREPRGWRSRRRRRGRRGDRGGMPESRFARPASEASESNRSHERTRHD